jgi:hypothetical protein
MRPFRADSAWGNAVRQGAARSLVLLLVVIVAACAGHGLRRDADGRYRNTEVGYVIDAPRFETEGDERWRPVSIDRTDLAWRTEDGRSMSLASTCKPTRARPALLARRLLIGVPRDDLIAAHPVALRGDAGWAQVVETGEEGQAIRIKTVTVVSAGCVFDWVLVAEAGPRFDESLPAFDAWWTSFERLRPPGEDAASAEPDPSAAAKSETP